MSGKYVNTPIPPISLVSDGKTKESLFKILIENKEKIASSKKRLSIQDQNKWTLQQRIIEVYMETNSVKRMIKKIDEEIISITKETKESLQLKRTLRR